MWALLAMALLFILGLLVFAWLCALAGYERDVGKR